MKSRRNGRGSSDFIFSFSLCCRRPRIIHRDFFADRKLALIFIIAALGAFALLSGAAALVMFGAEISVRATSNCGWRWPICIAPAR